MISFDQEFDYTISDATGDQTYESAVEQFINALADQDDEPEIRLIENNNEGDEEDVDFTLEILSNLYTEKYDHPDDIVQNKDTMSDDPFLVLAGTIMKPVQKDSVLSHAFQGNIDY